MCDGLLYRAIRAHEPEAARPKAVSRIGIALENQLVFIKPSDIPAIRQDDEKLLCRLAIALVFPTKDSPRPSGGLRRRTRLHNHVEGRSVYHFLPRRLYAGGKWYGRFAGFFD
jgi:hypothetical protein